MRASSELDSCIQFSNRSPDTTLPEGLDAQIKAEFGDLVIKACQNELDDCNNSSPGSSVAFVVLLDQFCRNLFRGTSEAFSVDAKA